MEEKSEGKRMKKKEHTTHKRIKHRRGFGYRSFAAPGKRQTG
jgi:hypothetical protein